MKGLNLIILLLSDLSILGANDVQYVLPGEFVFISRPSASVDVLAIPVASWRGQVLKVLHYH